MNCASMNLHRCALAGVLFAAACDRSGPIAPPDTPEAIRPPPGESVKSIAVAEGVQIYVCMAKANEPSAFEWSLKAPEADLRDKGGAPFGRHYAGPTWEAKDGSKIRGEVRAKVDAPDKSTIPWLLLEVKSSEGAGVLSSVKHVQRVDTSGGKAPSDGCDAAHVNAEARVKYSAKYYFYAPAS